MSQKKGTTLVLFGSRICDEKRGGDIDLIIEPSVDEDDISFFDQLIYRYMKLQDTMGEKLFPVALKLLGEDFSAKPFVDVLNRLERLCLISSREEWLVWRELRNDLSHEITVGAKGLYNGLWG